MAKLRRQSEADPDGVIAADSPGRTGRRMSLLAELPPTDGIAPPLPVSLRAAQAVSPGLAELSGAISGRREDLGAYLALAGRALRAPRSGLVLVRRSEQDEAAEPYLAWDGLGASEAAPAARLALQVMLSGRPMVVSERAAEPPHDGHAVEDALRSFVGVPLGREGGSVRGCLCVMDTVAREWGPDDLDHLRELGSLLEREYIVRLETAQIRTLENLVRMLGKAVENMQLGVTVTDLGGKIIYTNPAEARMHGYEVGELVGQHARLLGPPELCRALDPQELTGATSWTRESVNVRKDGTRFPVLLWSDQVTDAEGNCIGIVTCCEEITERKQAEQRLRDFAMRDPLTALPNRVYFLDRLTQAIHRGHADPVAQFAVLFLDLDRFKVVNDSLGHHVGDELLGVIAARLLGCVRPMDTVARFGGDEFAVLLEQISGLEDALRVAERIQGALAAPIHLNGYELFTSASIGIVSGSPGIDQPEYLWRSADMAMYRAKARGTGQYEVFDRAMHADALARLQLETDVRRALERDEFRLHYQPVICLATGRVVGFEALLRWEHPLRGMVFPAEVIPLSEETGLILRLGEWVMNEACRQLRRWQDELGGTERLWVGINLSSKQLSQPNLLDQVRAAVRDAGIEPELLKLEITESAIVEHTEVATETLRQLKAFGVQLYMDDFGTGYSSLSYLHRLPLDALKIDRSFISQMVRGDKHSQLVQTILQLARSINLRVVAEGVSTPDQLELLRELGCEMAQGFFFSHPLPPEQAEALIRQPILSGL